MALTGKQREADNMWHIQDYMFEYMLSRNVDTKKYDVNKMLMDREDMIANVLKELAITMMEFQLEYYEKNSKTGVDKIE